MGLPAIGDRLVFLPLDDKYEAGLNDRPKPAMAMVACCLILFPLRLLASSTRSPRIFRMQSSIEAPGLRRASIC